ncbi:site-specific DNA-methyltransferase [Bacillus altitudinis]|uniref:site-specific DNA-methyltransferase n=1 Tax=Bacillus altitudinis TaxID=293387 RepID=UPI002409DD78|nr:site-specific DNA-methyltransferase [Bacillus altitudinis]WEZ71218.1 site-specific DNA-methyltransferase [Bacillus altitudinis]
MEDATNIPDIEADIYSHLTNFYSRYYDDGDFISQRRYKDGVYSIPYEGEEVKLHWANTEQYYVKTSEYFKDYIFRTTHGEKVHFKIVEAEVEKDNNKQQEKRFFQLYEEKPFEVDNNELIIYFEYKEGSKKNQEQYFQPVIEVIEKAVVKYPSFTSLLDKQEGKTLIERQLKKYTARNTFDYFIHKDLMNFLDRELNFYIKNEVVYLEDIDTLDDNQIKQYLVKAKAIRNIGRKINTFLAQIEEFQKKLWEKKKFIVETNYCITLDRVPENFYEQIIVNEKQINEWKSLFFIEDLNDYSEPLTKDFLKQNPYLVLDTALFPLEFKEQLVEAIENLDEKIDGVLINSENFQGLNFIYEKYKSQVDAVYIDPPYNTKSSEILYKNNYKHSSWLSLIENRINFSKELNKDTGKHCVTIDDLEAPYLWTLLNEKFGIRNHLGTATIRINPGGRKSNRKLAAQHEYAMFYGKTDEAKVAKFSKAPEDKTHTYKKDKDGTYYEERNLRKEGQDSLAKPGSERFYPIYYSPETGEISTMKELEVEILPIDTRGQKRIWRRGKEDIDNLYKAGDVFYKETAHGPQIYFKFKGGVEGEPPRSFWQDEIFSASEHGTSLLNNIVGENDSFSFPKSLHAVKDSIKVMSDSNEAIVLDYFAGSGTTGHAVIELNREDEENGKRKYILIEMGEYFDSVTKPRIQKVIYSKDWKNGKPVSREGISHAFKYFQLESYEDALNNIEVNSNKHDLLSNAVKEQYVINYMLTNETKGSSSLLNIDMLSHPFEYRMQITQKWENKERNIDVVETFNYLLGLTVKRNHSLKKYDADFSTGEYGALKAKLLSGATYKFKAIEGQTLNQERVLVIWRDVTGEKEKDNAALNAFFEELRGTSKALNYKKIYVNGDNNLSLLRKTNESWKVLLIEEEISKLMFV